MLPEGLAQTRQRAQVDRDVFPLTAREAQVMEWVTAGKTNRDIAAILDISPRTVTKHLERIFVKLGVETRTAAVNRVLAGVR